MTLKVPATGRAVSDPSPIDLADPHFLPDMLVDAFVGVNLTAFGAFPTDFPGDDAHGVTVEHLNLAHLLSSISAAFHGGLDVVTLDRDFHTRSDADAQANALDGVRTVVKIWERAKNFVPSADNNNSRAALCAEVPSDPDYIRQAVKILSDGEVKRASILIALQDTSDFDDFEAAANEARAAGYKIWLVVTNPQLTLNYVDVVARIADVVRVRTTDRSLARTLRFSLLEAGEKLGRKILVLADLGVVISASLQAAHERDILVSQMIGHELFAGQSKIVGTVYDVADAIEGWIGAGAADGLIFTPASLPTDLASLLKGVLPLISARIKGH